MHCPVDGPAIHISIPHNKFEKCHRAATDADEPQEPAETSPAETIEGSLSPIGSPLILPPELQELARLVVACMGADSNYVCHEMLAAKVISSDSQILKDRWNGMARLSRFQRDGHSMLIPRVMRTPFVIYRDQLLSKRNKPRTPVPSVVTSAPKQIENPACKLKEPPLPEVVPPSTLPFDLQELARLVAECKWADSKNVCHETLASMVLSSECQMLKDRWSGMARLSRFQRDGYSMLIPRLMRQRFEIHLDDLIQSWKNSTKEAIVGIIAVKENSKTTCDLKKPAAAPRPKKKPAQFAEAGTNTDPRITRKYQEKEVIVIEAQHKNSRATSTNYPPVDEKLSAARERERCSAELSTQHRVREGPVKKRLKPAPETVPSAAISRTVPSAATPPPRAPVPSPAIEECKRNIDLFFKWRHHRLDLAHEQFLYESTRGWQAGHVDHAKSKLEAHALFQKKKLMELKERICTNLRGSSHRTFVQRFFETVDANWKVFFKEAVNAWGGASGPQDRGSVSERWQRDRYRFFLEQEQVCVQRHLGFLH